jgi:trk system potassium uptake protein TrkH
MNKFLKKLSSARIIALGFAAVILIGSLLLMLPVSLKEGIELSYADSLYTATSAVCVTGLATVDIGDTFTIFGQIVMAILIQIGGLGVASIGAGVILAAGKRMNLKSRNVFKEAMNIDTEKGMTTFLHEIFITAVAFEIVGAALSFIVFSRVYPLPKAMWVSLFHSIASFNNAGFDVLGGFQSLTAYESDVLLNLVTAALVFFGGIGFLVMHELRVKRFSWKKLSMHAKVVLSMSAALTVLGMLLFKLSEDMSWLSAFFMSVSARTAGFSSHSMALFTPPGLMVMMVLMVIGASPGSTGGGIKTSTFFVMLQGIKSSAFNKQERAFKYSVPKNYFKKAAVIFLLALGAIIASTYLLLTFDGEIAFIDALFEMASAFGTVGLSTGITPSLSLGSKIVSMVMMYIGRLGPLTIATLWYFAGEENVSYPEGNIAIG